MSVGKMASTGRKRRYYTGEHAYSVDSQRRIALPAAWRGEDEDERAFMLVPHEQPCIHMIPRATFDKMAPRLEEELFRNPDALVTMGSLGGYSSEVIVDKQGRFALSSALMEHAQIKDRVLMVGTTFTIALWSPEVWAARRETPVQASRVIPAAAARPEPIGQALRSAMGAQTEG